MDIRTACRRIEEHGYCLVEGLVGAVEAARLETRARQLMTDKIGKVKERNGYGNIEGALIQMPELAPLCANPVLVEIGQHFFGMPILFDQQCLH